MKAIDIIGSENLARYATFAEENPGCSKENAIVINDKDDYVPLEYDIVDLLLQQRKELIYYSLTHQALESDESGDKSYDCLTFNVIWMDPDTREFYNTEENYWFDITAGFNAMFEDLTEDQ